MTLASAHGSSPSTELHELVEAVAREGAAEPDVDEQEERDLAAKNQERAAGSSPGRQRRRRQHVAGTAGSQPPKNSTIAIEEIDDHVGVLGEEEEGELHPRVLGVEAGDQLRLGLGQVERVAVGLGDAADEVDEEGRRSRGRTTRARAPAAPRRSRPATGCPDISSTRDHGEAHRHLVRDHLRRRAQPAHQRELVVRRPAAEDDAVDPRPRTRRGRTGGRR